jgi:cbb3-type cytochrome oxidase maturation protein
MHIMFLLMGFSLFVATGFLIAFLWAVRSGQYDDNYTPSVRMLFDDGVSSDVYDKQFFGEKTKEGERVNGNGKI